MVNKKKIPKKTVKSKKREVSKKNKVIKIKKSGLILNPKTKRYVKATGKIGKQLLAKQVVQRGGGLYLEQYFTEWKPGNGGNGGSGIYAYIIERNDARDINQGDLDGVMDNPESMSDGIKNVSTPQMFGDYTLTKLQLVKGDANTRDGRWHGDMNGDKFTVSMKHSECFTCDPDGQDFLGFDQINIGQNKMFFQFHCSTLKTVLLQNPNYFKTGKGCIFPCGKILISNLNIDHAQMPIAEPNIGEGRGHNNKDRCIAFAELSDDTNDGDINSKFTDFPTVRFSLGNDTKAQKLVFLSKKTIRESC